MNRGIADWHSIYSSEKNLTFVPVFVWYKNSWSSPLLFLNDWMEFMFYAIFYIIELQFVICRVDIFYIKNQNYIPYWMDSGYWVQFFIYWTLSLKRQWFYVTVLDSFESLSFIPASIQVYINLLFICTIVVCSFSSD